MKIQMTNNNTVEIERSLIALGLKGLEAYVDHDTTVYILRTLYNIVQTSANNKEDKLVLKSRIKHFEEESNLPAFLTTIPIEQLLEELEDAQYFYPIRRREMEFPTFH